MNAKDYFKDIYNDFFGIEKPLKVEVEQEEVNSQTKMAKIFESIILVFNLGSFTTLLILCLPLSIPVI